MNDLCIRDNPDRVGSPEAPDTEYVCDKCGEPIYGNYYDLDGFVYCELCMQDFCEDSRKAPSFVQTMLLDAMDEYKVIGG